eukprot:3177709-Alexandrium_andersonii.AAC.1
MRCSARVGMRRNPRAAGPTARSEPCRRQVPKRRQCLLHRCAPDLLEEVLLANCSEWGAAVSPRAAPGGHPELLQAAGRRV